MIVQKLRKETRSDIGIASVYYSVLSAFNGLLLTDREIELMAFIAVSGSISISDNRKAFCETYGTTSATVNNMVSKLKKKGLLVKKDGRVVVSPIISLDFTKDIQLEMKIVHGGK